MKKLTLTLTAAAAATMLALTGCAGGTQAKDSHASHEAAAKTTADDSRPLVLTTFTVIADMARNVAGDHLRVESITKPGAEIHDYEPTPKDIARASDAKLIVNNGLGLERWFEKFVAHSKAQRVNLSEGVEPMLITEDAYKGEPNPHAWMSPVNAKIYTKNLVAAFKKLDPKHADDYQKNGDAYLAKLDEVQTSITEGLAKLPQNERALVTCEGAFSYLARDAKLTEHYLWPVNAESEGTPKQMASAVKFVKENRVPAVFCESTVNNKAMKQVVSATGAKYGGELYVDSLSQAGGPVPTYLDLLRYDAKKIVTALTGKSSQ